MAARAIGTASISFGLVSIPTKIYSAGEASRKISFNLIDKNSGSRLKQQYISQKTGEIVPREDMIKGYEFAKDQYVTFTPEELKELEEKGTGAVEITEFVPADSVDRLYLDKVYYLGPDKGGDRAYKLLSRALRESGKVAIGKYAARGKGYLVAIRPVEDGLAMEQLLYEDEVRSFEEVPTGDAEIKDEEMKLANQLIEQATSDEFDPSKYEDEVRQRILDLIQRKVEGEDITVAATEEPQTQVIDLMEALKQSLQGGEKKEARKKTAKKASAKRKRSRKKKKKKKASA